MTCAAVLGNTACSHNYKTKDHVSFLFCPGRISTPNLVVEVLHIVYFNFLCVGGESDSEYESSVSVGLACDTRWTVYAMINSLFHTFYLHKHDFILSPTLSPVHRYKSLPQGERNAAARQQKIIQLNLTSE